jgi:hypothetical protein
MNVGDTNLLIAALLLGCFLNWQYQQDKRIERDNSFIMKWDGLK